jgi:hypothetical protein
MDDYPFIVNRAKLVKIRAPNLSNALDRVTTKHPNKIINVKFARNMDLISAKVEAAKQSRATGKKVYIIVDENDGECSLSNAPLRGVLHCYNNGSEIYDTGDMQEGDATKARANKRSKKIPAQSQKAKELIEKKEATASSVANSEKEVKTKKEKVMATKPAKKAAQKKAKAVKNAVKKEVKAPAGEKKKISVANILSLLKKGHRIYRQKSPHYPFQYPRLKDYANKEKVMETIIAPPKKVKTSEA